MGLRWYNSELKKDEQRPLSYAVPRKYALFYHLMLPVYARSIVAFFLSS